MQSTQAHFLPPWALAFSLLLVACSTPAPAPYVAAAATPLADFNVGQAEIPALLQEAQKRPYAPPTDASCPQLGSDVRALDELLGPDVDANAPPSNALGDTAVGAFKGAVEGLVPYRGWIRKISGAERFSKEVAAAVAAGNARRAFLKGMRLAHGCE